MKKARNPIHSACRSTRRQAGQGMTEYIVIVALVAVAAIGVVTVFGDNVRQLFATAASGLAGEASSDSGAKTADSKLRAGRTLKDFAADAKKQR
ncbi:MAG TPA: hypothetical protein VN033_07145 [Vulgatibacter sp.]|nr:hypothetical protein [Vulgatibacter sp.]